MIKYSLHSAIENVTAKLKILSIGVALLTLGGAGLVAAPASADSSSNGKVGSSTTLDACGYFVGTQTPSNTKTSTGPDGTVYITQHGTWTGVNNDYVNTPVASLGKVQGSYEETTTTAPDGTVTGTETFTSNAGKIDQTFTYGPYVPGGFSVSVTSTRNLSFLTSDTNGHCYDTTTNPFPRP